MKRMVAVLLAMVLCSWAPWAEEGSHGAKSEKRNTVKLFNGKNLEGWKPYLKDKNVNPRDIWSVKDGVIHCTGASPGYIRTREKYSDYRLTVQWRWPGSGGNSGVLLHIQDVDDVWPKSIECQLLSGNAADFWVIGGTDFKEHTNKDERRVPKMSDSTEKPLGEWNTYVIECRGDTIKSYVNGKLQNHASETTVTKGYIGLQSEGTPIEFRNVSLERLEK